MSKKLIFTIVFLLISIFTFVIILLTFYYFYKFLFKKNSLIFDIIIFYISLAISFLISIKLFSCSCFNILVDIIGFLGILILVYLYKFFNQY